MLTRQEMFDRAWKGLKAQGWTPAYNHAHSRCEYLTGSGKRCAWGHVDPEGTEALSLIGFASLGILYITDRVEKDPEIRRVAPLTAALADDAGLRDFAADLQNAHDTVAMNNDSQPDDYVRAELQRAMHLFAEAHGLTIPE